MSLLRVSFTPLGPTHFFLLLKWLQRPHVRAWWDSDVDWTPESIAEKYKDCIEGMRDGKPLHGFIMCVDGWEIGYIQYYNAYDFARDIPLVDLPESLAAIDLYIGEPEYIGKGLGTELINAFLKEHVFKEFKAVFVDPDISNTGAIRAYEKAGFKEVKKVEGTVWMLCLQ